LEFGTTGTVADGYQLVEIVPDKTTVKIAGPGANSISSITFPSELINISGAKTDVSVTADIEAQLPTGVYLYNSSDSTVSVTAKIEQLITKTYKLPISEIDKVNIPDGYTADIVESQISIDLIGLQKYHDDFDSKTLDPYVDLKNAVEGANEVMVKFTLPDNMKTNSEVRVTVNLTAQADSGTTTETTTAAANESDSSDTGE